MNKHVFYRPLEISDKIKADLIVDPKTNKECDLTLSQFVNKVADLDTVYVTREYTIVSGNINVDSFDLKIQMSISDGTDYQYKQLKIYLDFSNFNQGAPDDINGLTWYYEKANGGLSDHFKANSIELVSSATSTPYRIRTTQNRTPFVAFKKIQNYSNNYTIYVPKHTEPVKEGLVEIYYSLVYTNGINQLSFTVRNMSAALLNKIFTIRLPTINDQNPIAGDGVYIKEIESKPGESVDTKFYKYLVTEKELTSHSKLLIY